MRRFLLALPAAIGICILPSLAPAADWTAYRGDGGRSGFTSESLPTELSLQWQYRPRNAPNPAWPRDDRMTFDRAPHVVAANGMLYFGNSVDGKIRALDAKTAEEKWSYYTDGPIRFAPVLWKDKLFAVSDDGRLYCLNASDGSLEWKKRGGPRDDRVLGNETIISRWPARGGPVIYDDVLYFAAGIWQSENVFLYAVDPQSGKTLWTNDEAGTIYMAQPHGGAYANSGVSAQGHLVADEEQLYVPTGRAVPAVFNRKDGKFKFYHLQANGHMGGTSTAVVGEFFYNGGGAFTKSDGALRSRLGVGPVAAFGDLVLHHNGSRLAALKQVKKKTKDRKGKEITVDTHDVAWTADKIPGGTSLLVAGSTAVSGGDREVALIDLKTRKVVSTLPVDGVAFGLAVADGRLIVTTDKGTIYNFAATPAQGKPKVVEESAAAFAGADDDQYQQAAKEILKQSNVTEGYCIDLGCGDGSLSAALAQNSKLQIIAVDSDPKNVEVARKQLEAAGLYGNRVAVLHADDLQKTHLPKFIANLVVSGRSVAGGIDAVPMKEAQRLQRPYGGVVCVGKTGEMKPDVRGELKNAGSWSHLYGNPANTASTEDDVKGPLSVLWFQDVPLELPQRHGRGPSPLFHQGRLFAEGMDELRGVDAYNGRTLWTFALKGILEAYDADHIVGASQTGSNFCAAGDSVYVRQDGHCYRLDAATGKELGKFTVPKRKDGKPGRWGYIACENGVLFGSVVNEDHIVRHAWRRADKEMKQLFTESDTLFALDAKTGRQLWRYDAKHSIRHNAIAVGDNQVFLIDRPLAEGDRLDSALRRKGKKPAPKHETGTLVSLNAKTGKPSWSNSKDVFGTTLAFNENVDALMMSYQNTRFKLPSEVGGRLAVFRASEGYRLWDKKANYVTRPVINGRTIIAQGGAWDLLTGKEQEFELKRSYGCGQIAASKNLLLFRSATLGYLDLSRDAGTESYGGIRPGCWINALPAGNLVFIPDASAGCVCSYQNRAWMALQGTD